MRVILYDNGSSDEVINKNLTQIADLNIEPYNELDLINPTLILSDMEIANIDRCNYCYIEELERYYFCTPTLGNNGIYTLMCNIDVLMSFSNEILKLYAIVDKNQYESNMYLNDGSFITEARESVEVVNFSGGFNDSGRFILITAGG